MLSDPETIRALSPDAIRKTYEAHIRSRKDPDLYGEFKVANGLILIPTSYPREVDDPDPVFSLQYKTNKCIYDITQILPAFTAANPKVIQIETLITDPTEIPKFNCKICLSQIDWLTFNWNEKLRDDVLDILDAEDENEDKNESAGLTISMRHKFWTNITAVDKPLPSLEDHIKTSGPEKKSMLAE